MSSQELTESVSQIRANLVGLLDTLDARMTDPRLDQIIEHGESLESKNLGQQPERCVEDTLIWPTLEALGFEYTPRPYYPVGETHEWPDFRIDNLSERVIGENKSVNRFGAGKADMESYLDSQRYEYGVVTDGFRWGLYEIVTDDSSRAVLTDVIEEQDLTPAAQQIARDQGLVSYTKKLHSEASVEEILGQFYQAFNHYAIRREIGGLTEFYDLYVEVVSGKGEYQQLDSNLFEGVTAPESASQSDRIAFATLLIDRLALVKLLVDRGVIGGVSLHEMWQEHTQGLNKFRGSFYSQYLKPLFYEILDMPPVRRDEELPVADKEIPHLGGGLFAPILSDEWDYDVPDTVMKPILVQLVENEERTLINEAAGGSLLQSYTELGTRDLAGQIPEHYADIVDAYDSEIGYVESEIKRTLRSFSRD